ncbi:hypothetical protein LSAT2_014150 [Lamellibrachia satsuma]|nr:hypothetical protein LSAT2_014150 [Lamellibrachia satsuma]
MMEIIRSGEMNPEKVAEVQNLLSSLGIALNHVSLIQARLLGSNVTVRRQTAQFLRSKPIGLPELFGNKCGEALKIASDKRQKQFIMHATLGLPRKPKVRFPGPQKGRLSKGKTDTFCRIYQSLSKPPTNMPKFTHSIKGAGAGTEE